jgi:predicted membrane-bound spermidine synthase
MFKVYWLIIFAISGAASLSYQVVWQRILTQEIGVDSISVTLIISIFMLGLGLGSLLGSKALAITPKLLSLLAMIEVFIGLFGFFSENLIREINRNLLQGSGLSLQILVNFCILLFPTLAMGASTPIMIQIFRNISGGPRNVGTAYSANIFGAAIGILSFGLLGVGTFGLTKSLHVIAILDFVIAILVLVQTKNYRVSEPYLDLELNSKRSQGKIFKVYFAVFLIGFSALGLEIVLFRLLTSYFGVTPYIFPIMLFAYLINMALGTYLGGKSTGNILKESELRRKLFSRIFFSLTITFLPIFFLPKLLYSIGTLIPSFYQAPLFFVFDTSKNGFDSNFVTILAAIILSTVLLIPVCVISSILPKVVNFVNHKDLEGTIFGKLYFFQTIGNAIGSLTTGFILFRFINASIIAVILILVCFFGVVLLLSYFNSSKSIVREKLGLVVSPICLALIIASSFYPDIRYFRSETEAISPIWIKESIHGATLVYDAYGDQKTYRVTSGGRFHVTTLPGKIDPNIQDGLTEPLIYGINSEIQDILFIGLGTATELLNFRRLYPNCKITIIEINPDVIAAFQKFAPKSLLDEINRGSLYIGDGRRYLQSNPTARFDLVHIGVDRASTTGAGNLFSKDFLSLIKTHLKPRGVVSFYSYPNVVKAAINVFGDVVVFSKVGSIGHTFATVEKNEIISAEFWRRYTSAVGKVGGELGFSNVSTKVEGASIYYPYSALKRVLSKIEESTDNMILTEYYINSRTEIIPGLYKLGSPVDYRIWPVNDLALNFSPKQNPKVKKFLSEGYSLSGSSIAKALKGISNYPSFVPTVLSSSVNVNFGVLPKVDELISKGSRFQWDFKSIESPIEGIWDIKISCQKQGRGVWGLQFNLLSAEDSKVITLGTRSSKRTTLTFAFKVDANIDEIIPSITFEDANSISSGRASLKCYEFSIVNY